MVIGNEVRAKFLYVGPGDVLFRLMMSKCVDRLRVRDGRITLDNRANSPMPKWPWPEDSREDRDR